MPGQYKHLVNQKTLHDAKGQIDLPEIRYYKEKQSNSLILEIVKTNRNCKSS